MTASVTVLGIRHHGPGSARAVARALDELQPDCVLIEGPPELDAVAPLAASVGMQPPVAALVYRRDEPEPGAAVDRTRRASFFPFATFSPEWVALRWAQEHGVQVQFADLPAVHQLADPTGDDDADGPGIADADPTNLDGDDEPDLGGEPETGSGGKVDPLGALAAAAGFTDPERWWEDAVEHRAGGLEVFAAVREAMAELRADGTLVRPDTTETLRREAAMRKVLRAAMKDHERVAFVCGAWHAPVLDPDAFPKATADNALLKGLPKVKVAATWVPWTAQRLAFASGYGAGVSSPGWYDHLFTAPDRVSERWLTRTARLLREEQFDASSASVIEAVRLADALAALRGRPIPGLGELTDATQAVLCEGSSLPLRVVADRLIVGHDLGTVPSETPMVPLARDLERLQKRLRLKPSAVEATVAFDLRKERDLERSHLMHRLHLLGIHWGREADAGRTRGTFKEAWTLEWVPELSLALIDASGSGTTIVDAAVATVRQRAAEADVADLTLLVEQALLADLPDALAVTMGALAERSAQQHDTVRLMAAVEPLARVSRYGNVRGVDTEAVVPVLRTIATRVAIGLGPACSSLDDDAAASMRDHIDSVHRGLATLDDPDLRAGWTGALAALAERRGGHGAVTGRAVRLLLDGGHLDRDDVALRMGQALSRGADAQHGAAWLDGFLTGDAALLLHDPGLLAVIDGWVAAVPTEQFDDLLPLIRRTFSAYTRPERRLIGDQVRRLDGSGSSTGTAHRGAGADTVDHPRARRAVPVLQQILGLDAGGGPS